VLTRGADAQSIMHENNVYYHSSDDTSSPIMKLSKAEILAIKKKDGTSVVFSEEHWQEYKS